MPLLRRPAAGTGAPAAYMIQVRRTRRRVTSAAVWAAAAALARRMRRDRRRRRAYRVGAPAGAEVPLAAAVAASTRRPAPARVHRGAPRVPAAAVGTEGPACRDRVHRSGAGAAGFIAASGGGIGAPTGAGAPATGAYIGAADSRGLRGLTTSRRDGRWGSCGCGTVSVAAGACASLPHGAIGRAEGARRAPPRRAKIPTSQTSERCNAGTGRQAATHGSPHT